MSDLDKIFMRAALKEARVAADQGEVPVGAVITVDGAIVARAGNRTITDCDPTATRNYRLLGATLYVTMEPCAMCAGAMIQARVDRLVYGAPDPKGGAVQTCFSIFDHPQINHRVDVTPGLLAEEAASLLKNFFAVRR